MPPPDGAKSTTWFKRVFNQLATVLKKLDKRERKEKLEKHYKEWQTGVLEGLSGQHYEVPPELVVEDSDDEEGDEDDSNED